jgi:hypothetical protein
MSIDQTFSHASHIYANTLLSTDPDGTHSFNKRGLSTSGLFTVIVVACGFRMILAVLAAYYVRKVCC